MTASAGDIVRLSVVEAARLVREGELSPVDLVEASLARIKAHDGDIKAWVDVYEEDALAAGRRAEEDVTRARKEGRDPAPLAGIPFGIKDVLDVAGKPTRAGSKAFLREPDAHAAAVQILLDAGAILIGKTTTAELVFSDAPETRNPWNADHSPGGSSSGSAAAIAAGMVPFALGTQTMGSLVRPAAFCGNSTIKATYGAVSREGGVPSAWTLDHVGALSRTIADQALVLPVLMATGRHGAASLLPEGVTADDVGPWAAEQVKGMIIGIPDRFFLEDDLDADVRAGFDAGIAVLEELGAEFTEIKLPPSFEAAQSAAQIILRVEAATYHKDSYRERGELMGPKIRRMLTSGNMIPGAVYARAQQLRRVYIRELTEAMAPVQAVVTPPAPTPAPRGLDFTGSPVFNGPFSLAGMPAAGFPTGFAESTGLPLGLQVIAPLHQERTVFTVGAAFQSVTEWHKAMPKL